MAVLFALLFEFLIHHVDTLQFLRKGCVLLEKFSGFLIVDLGDLIFIFLKAIFFEETILTLVTAGSKALGRLVVAFAVALGDAG